MPKYKSVSEQLAAARQAKAEKAMSKISTEATLTHPIKSSDDAKAYNIRKALSDSGKSPEEIDHIMTQLSSMRPIALDRESKRPEVADTPVRNDAPVTKHQSIFNQSARPLQPPQTNPTNIYGMNPAHGSVRSYLPQVPNSNPSSQPPMYNRNLPAIQSEATYHIPGSSGHYNMPNPPHYPPPPQSHQNQQPQQPPHMQPPMQYPNMPPVQDNPPSHPGIPRTSQHEHQVSFSTFLKNNR